MRNLTPTSGAAIWSRRVALVSLQLFLLTILLHQFAGLATPVAMRLFGVAVIGAGLAVAIALFALVHIWRDGVLGTGRALMAMAAAALVLAGPAWSLPSLVTQPRVTEATTDPQSPPPFRKLASERADVQAHLRIAADESVPGADPGRLTLEPIEVQRSAEETFSLVRESAQELGWKIVSATPPAEGEPGHIEAVARSMLFGIKGDVAIRVRGGQSRARVDVRSASRYVQHDLGTNADRISSLFGAVETAVAKLEKNEEIARLAKLRAERAKRVREAREAKERRARRQAYDSVSRQWRAPSARQSRRQSRRTRRSRQRQRTRELRRFWESMQN